jgi:multisubunit Na+/H+ antiporter MnhG subunit
MSATFLAMVSGALVSRYFKKEKWWLKAHKGLNIAALILAALGILVIAISVQASGGPHFRVRHAFYGAAALILLLTSPVLGFAIFKAKDKKKIQRIKMLHRWSGRITIVLMAAAVIAGFSLIGFF